MKAKAPTPPCWTTPLTRLRQRPAAPRRTRSSTTSSSTTTPIATRAGSRGTGGGMSCGQAWPKSPAIPWGWREVSGEKGKGGDGGRRSLLQGVQFVGRSREASRELVLCICRDCIQIWLFKKQANYMSQVVLARCKQGVPNKASVHIQGISTKHLKECMFAHVVVACTCGCSCVKAVFKEGKA